MSLTTILIILLVIVLLGGVGFTGPRYGWGPSGGLLGIVLVVLLILFLTGRIPH